MNDPLLNPKSLTDDNQYLFQKNKESILNQQSFSQSEFPESYGTSNEDIKFDINITAKKNFADPSSMDV